MSTESTPETANDFKQKYMLESELKTLLKGVNYVIESNEVSGVTKSGKPLVKYVVIDTQTQEIFISTTAMRLKNSEGQTYHAIRRISSESEVVNLTEEEKKAKIEAFKAAIKMQA